MPRQTTNTVLMIRPKHFGFNHQTAESNTFQHKPISDAGEIAEMAIKEFDELVHALRKVGIQVIVIEDQDDERITDSIFPNNWIAFNHDGSVYTFPMESENRRLERRTDLIDQLKNKHNFRINQVIDLSSSEQQNKFLEGTGSMVFDHEHRKVYACLSSRTNKELVITHAAYRNYEPILFHARDSDGNLIYHTNVMMSIGNKFVVICLVSITDEEEKVQVIHSLKSNGLVIIELSQSQIEHFAGNMLQLINIDDDPVIVMSQAAYDSLSPIQRTQFDSFGRVVSPDLSTIESVGGGSARCMIAEVFLSKKK